MERRTEGNAELIEAAADKLAEILEEHDLDSAKMLAAIDSPLDEKTIYMLIPRPELIALLFSEIQVVGGDGEVTVMMPSPDFFGMLGSLCVRAFLHGYVAAKMEAGEL
jgi:hypothetical protein